ncbi:MarR family winged helix-turn-helix transcriptional regulator [Timonella senegalensis]|uniref:MarR family winged helix-turn-helix transcriptional regulator n=1 Tax=Timonella senegalensis TaxID=1465825 RepID=UPI0002D482F5|nr:MarR family transcriptional regulator [Timonella senegalensis]
MSKDKVSHIQEQWRVERPDIDSSPVGVVGRVHRLGNYLRREILAVYREHGLGEGEFDILATLRRRGAPFTMLPTDLGRQTMVTSGGISKQLDRLEASGLVERSVSSDDARKRLVTLTAKGKSVIDAAYTEHMENEARLLTDLDPADREALEGILGRWLAAVEAANEPPGE